VLCYWQDNQGVTKYDLNKQCKPLAQEFEWVGKLNSMARQSAAERPWSAISCFYDNCKKQKLGKKGDPRYQNVGAQRHLGGRFPKRLRR
jgi:putative transposase